MGTLTVRKNFSFDKDIVDKVNTLLQEKNTTFTKLLTNYFQAIIKEPELINEVEQKAKQRTASFIGLLDGKIGDIDAKEMKRAYHENLS